MICGQEGQELPPPAYQPMESRVTVPPSSTPSVKLPTYDQSEKFAKGEVVLVAAVPVEEDSDSGDDNGRTASARSGTLFEFVLFFFCK